MLAIITTACTLISTLGIVYWILADDDGEE